MKNKNKVNQLISHLSSCLYIISGIVLLSTGRTALAIDYIEITNPKFIPVKVGVAIGAGAEADEVQKIFKANLDKVLYFQIIPETKQEYEDSGNIVFHVELELKNYLNELSEFLSEDWEVPIHLKESQVTVAIMFEINKNGKILNWELEESGSPALHNSVNNLMKNLQFLPALPKSYPENSYIFGVRFSPKISQKKDAGEK